LAEVGSVKMALSRPAHQRVTQAVGQPVMYRKGGIMSKWFMLRGATHHKIDTEEGLYLHYSDTCNVHNFPKSATQIPWAKSSTSVSEKPHLHHPRVGFVDIDYETKGVITFFARISPKRAAWQRIEWKPNFHTDWENDKEVRSAIENFLWVAMCEEAKRILLKKWWL